MRTIIVGCGRVGASLAGRLVREGDEVTVIDVRTEAFERLDDEFPGQAVRADGTDEDALRRAGAEGADRFFALTEGDNRNIIEGQLEHYLWAYQGFAEREDGDTVMRRAIATIDHAAGKPLRSPQLEVDRPERNRRRRLRVEFHGRHRHRGSICSRHELHAGRHLCHLLLRWRLRDLLGRRCLLLHGRGGDRGDFGGRRAWHHHHKQRQQRRESHMNQNRRRQCRRLFLVVRIVLHIREGRVHNRDMTLRIMPCISGRWRCLRVMRGRRGNCHTRRRWGCRWVA